MSLASANSSSASDSFGCLLANQNIEPMLNNLQKIMPNLLQYLPLARFFPISALEEMISRHLKGSLSNSDTNLLKLLVQRKELRSMVALQSKLEGYLTFKNLPGGKHFCKKTPVELVASQGHKSSTNGRNIEQNRQKPTSSSSAEFSECPDCLITEKLLEETQKELEIELRRSQETESELRRYLVAHDAENSDKDRIVAALSEKLEETTEKLDEADEKLNECSAKLAVAELKLEEERSMNADLAENLNACRDSANTLCLEMITSLKDSRKNEERSNSSLMRKYQKVQNLRNRLRTITNNDDELLDSDSSMSDLEMTMSSANRSIRDPRAPTSSSQFSPFADTSMTSPTPIITLNRSRMLTVKLDSYQKMKKQFDDQKILGCLSQLLNSYQKRVKNEEKVAIAKKEITDFRNGYGTYMALLEYNIKLMIENPSMRPDNLIPMPEPPNWAAMTFVKDYEAATKQTVVGPAGGSEPGENECAICLEDVTERSVFLKCPVCTIKYHTRCIVKYLQQHSKCPVCQGVLRQ